VPGRCGAAAFIQSSKAGPPGAGRRNLSLAAGAAVVIGPGCANADRIMRNGNCSQPGRLFLAAR
jgi:hypothetical protein